MAQRVYQPMPLDQRIAFAKYQVKLRHAALGEAIAAEDWQAVRTQANMIALDVGAMFILMKQEKGN